MEKKNSEMTESLKNCEVVFFFQLLLSLLPLFSISIDLSFSFIKEENQALHKEIEFLQNGLVKVFSLK